MTEQHYMVDNYAATPADFALSASLELIAVDVDEGAVLVDATQARANLRSRLDAGAPIVSKFKSVANGDQARVFTTVTVAYAAPYIHHNIIVNPQATAQHVKVKHLAKFIYKTVSTLTTASPSCSEQITT